MNIKRYDFIRKKYDREFLMDCVFFSETKASVTVGRPFIYNFYGIFIINKGTGKIASDLEITPFSKGSIIFFQPNQVREWIDVSADFNGYLLLFENEFIESFFRDSLFMYRFQLFQNNQSAILRCDDRFLSEHLHICEKIKIELDHLQDDSHHYIRSLLYNILIQMNREYVRGHDLSVNLYQDNTLLRLRKLLEENINAKLRIEDYASLLNISRSQLNRAIKKTLGKPASKVIRERLLTQIKSELLYSEKNISEIAYDLGFSDHSNFVRFYKKLTGQTPSEFRSDGSK